MLAVVEGTPLAAPTAPRLAESRPINGRLLRLAAYLMMSFGAMLGPNGADPALGLPGIALARCVAREPQPGDAGSALARIDSLLEQAENVAVADRPRSLAAFGLVHAALAIAATEPVVARRGLTPRRPAARQATSASCR